MLTPLFQPSTLTFIKSEAEPWNQVAIIQPSSAQTVRKRSQSPESRQTTQFSRTSLIASFSVILPIAPQAPPAPHRSAPDPPHAPAPPRPPPAAPERYLQNRRRPDASYFPIQKWPSRAPSPHDRAILTPASDGIEECRA